MSEISSYQPTPDPSNSQPERGSSLVRHAQRELALCGLDQRDSIYDGMIATDVIELIEVFSKQGHSGQSAAITLMVFNKLASYKPLKPITSNTDEWMLITDTPTDQPIWQSKRKPSCFSYDSGKTWYDIDDPKSFRKELRRRKMAKIRRRLTKMFK